MKKINMMLVPSTGHDGQDGGGGGVYQTGRSANIASLIKIIEPIYLELQQEFPSIKKSFLMQGVGVISQVCNSLSREGTFLLDLRLIQQDALWRHTSFKTYWENTLFLKLHYSRRMLQYQAIGWRWLFSIFGT
jgi:hypothetical protein